MSRALFVIDVQNDFTEGGSLGVDGGAAVAAGITEYLNEHADRYEVIVASRDWHDGDNDNGGHFSENPDFVDSWPRHCVAGSPGAEYHPALDDSQIDVHVRKGQGKPAYSIFEGVTDEGESVPDLLDRLEITDIDVVGIATDYCVLASALDAVAAGRSVSVRTNLVAGVAPESTAHALAKLAQSGVTLIEGEK